MIDRLLWAQQQALLLFEEAEKRQLVAPGKTESVLNNEIYELAFEMFGIRKYWHKRIVRAGANTLLPYRENPPDLTLQDDDILFFDFGPVFEEWETDLGRTYVIGNNPRKLKLQSDIATAWQKGSNFYQAHSNITGAQLYQYICQLANDDGWQFGAAMAGHLIGHFPHENLENEKPDNYIHPHNHKPMRANYASGKPRYWILEIHFIDPELKIGGFYEQVLH